MIFKLLLNVVWVASSHTPDAYSRRGRRGPCSSWLTSRKGGKIDRGDTECQTRGRRFSTTKFPLSSFSLPSSVYSLPSIPLPPLLIIFPLFSFSELKTLQVSHTQFISFLFSLLRFPPSLFLPFVLFTSFFPFSFFSSFLPKDIESDDTERQTREG